MEAADGEGTLMMELVKRIYPLCRSITGNGVRETLGIIREHIPVEIHEVPSGTGVFDWTVPKEWNIRDAYIKGPDGKKFAEFSRSNLHVMGYSVPIRKKMPLEELKAHLSTIPGHPEWVPYKTSYYKEGWGFCLQHKDFLGLKKGEYEAVIDSTLENGSLTFGELLIKGKSSEEVLFSTYVCHPSLCNDNLSGVALTTSLAKRLMAAGGLRYSYRFLFIPETIGSIAWLHLNKDGIKRIKHGLVVTCVGDSGNLTYKKSRDGNREIDQAVIKVLADSNKPHRVEDFYPIGSDERQFCSPGFNLPIGSLMRTPYCQYPEYHTSADDLSFVKPESLGDSLRAYLQVVHMLENNARYVNIHPECEPYLGKHGVYQMLEKHADRTDDNAVLWVLNQSDGNNSLLDISVRSKLSFGRIKAAADILCECKLLRRADKA